jgi:DNA polymerase III epsilon subunit-like protein
MTTAIAFVDTETTHLDPRHGDVWEVAVIRRHEDGVDAEYLWQLRPDLTKADPESLAIGKFHDRFAVPDGWDSIEIFPAGGPPLKSKLPEMLYDLQESLQDAVLVGSNPGFDVAFLTKLLQAHNRKLPWHYRPVDIATLAAGYRFGQRDSGVYGGDFAFPGDLPSLPFSSRKLSKAVGVEPPGDEVAHTAMGDARWARDVYDAVLGGRA